MKGPRFQGANDLERGYAMMIEGGRVPVRWGERAASPGALLQDSTTESECMRIAFINNMPDAALEDTEMQFFELIEAAAGDTPVRVNSIRCLEFRVANGPGASR